MPNAPAAAPAPLKIYDTRTLEHPRPLEIMSDALKYAHGGAILVMVHRREPFPLYDIIRAQGLTFRAFESDFDGTILALESRKTLESLESRESLESQESRVESAEFAIIDEMSESVAFTRDFYMQSACDSSAERAFAPPAFFIFIAQAPILRDFDAPKCMRYFAQNFTEKTEQS